MKLTTAGLDGILAEAAEGLEERRFIDLPVGSVSIRIRRHAAKCGLAVLPGSTDRDMSLGVAAPSLLRPVGFKRFRVRLEPHEDGSLIRISFPVVSFARTALISLVSCILAAGCYSLAAIGSASPPDRSQPLFMPMVAFIGLVMVAIASTAALGSRPHEAFTDSLYELLKEGRESPVMRSLTAASPLTNAELLPMALSGLAIYLYAKMHLANLFGIPVGPLRGPEGAINALALGCAALGGLTCLSVLRPYIILRSGFLAQALLFNFGLVLYILSWELYSYMAGALWVLNSEQRHIAQCLVAGSTVLVLAAACYLIVTAVQMSARQADLLADFQDQETGSIWKTALENRGLPGGLFAGFTIALWIALSIFNVSWTMRSVLTILLPTALFDSVRSYSLAGGDPRARYLEIAAHILRAIPMLALLYLVIRKYIDDFGDMESSAREPSSQETRELDSALTRLSVQLQMFKPVVRILRRSYVDAYISVSQQLILTERTLQEFKGEELEALLAHELWHLKRHGRTFAALTVLSDWTFFGYGALAALLDSRRMEFEADEFAVRWCESRKLPPRILGAVLLRIDEINERELGTHRNRSMGIVSLCLKKELRRQHDEARSWDRWADQLREFYRLYFRGQVLSYIHPSLTERILRIAQLSPVN